MRLFLLRGSCFALIVAATAAFADPTVTIRGHLINDWTYQLQGHHGQPLALDEIGATAYDLAVIDYSADGSADGEFTADQIAALKASPGGPKIVLAYLSIGEAEDYRWYWDSQWTDSHSRLTASAPAWLLTVNKNWVGNYRVRYWDPDWQKLIFGQPSGPQKSSLDRILAAGFDGVYLDLVDAFESFHDRATAPQEMATFVETLASYARQAQPNFIVVAQNGSELANVLPAPALQDYFATIDALGVEDSFFYGSRAMNNPFRPQTYTLKSIAKFQDAGLPILSIDYVSTSAKVDKFYRTAHDYGFVPYAGPRELDRIKIHPGWEPD